MKQKRQHAILTLIDGGINGYNVRVTYQPSLKGRQTTDDSPSVNAMIRICILLARAKEQMGQPLQFEDRKPLTFGQKLAGFFKQWTSKSPSSEKSN